MNHWLSLITTLPTENATVRQRIWRALKTSGAAVLRDGVYLMPETQACRSTLDGLAQEVRESSGTAMVLRLEEPNGANFIQWFDRSEDYASVMAEVAPVRDALTANTVHEITKLARKLRKNFSTIAAIDFFPGEAQRQVDASLRELEQAIARTLSPNEPLIISGEVQPRLLAQYQRRTWATRQRPWVDRLASAWLIRRYIDPQAQFVWLANPMDCPPDALSFDFDGATFSHVGSRVTFEVLLESFSITQPALARLGLLVHFLDVGGVQPPEAVGVESILAGLREALSNDDELLAVASKVFDGLLATFEQKNLKHETD